MSDGSFIQDAISNASSGVADPRSDPPLTPDSQRAASNSAGIEEITGYESQPVSVLEESEVDPESQDPPGIVRFHVYSDGPSQFRVLAFDPLIGNLSKGPSNDPNLYLSQMVQSNHPQRKLPKDIRDLLYEFSFSISNREIRQWLNKLFEAYKTSLDQLCLVIADNTDLEIPWEMFNLSHNQYLGALITTVRWQNVESEDETIYLKFEEEECCGGVVAYINHEELKGVQPEIEALRQIDSHTYIDIKEFRSHLERDEKSLSLVYMACHGLFEDEKDILSLSLGSQHDARQRLRLTEVRRSSLRILKASRAIVFINACNSGLLRESTKYIRDGYRRGFPEVFLGKGARGVIGALGGVRDDYAAKFGSDLIKDALRSPDTPVPVLLRNLRDRVVKRLPDDPTEDESLRFIYSFMYVYYGNPRTLLRLTKGKG